MFTPGLMDDVVDTSRLFCVPMTFRTDGTWVWSEASAYYAKQYRLQPDFGLLTHLRRNDYALPEVDSVMVYRALQALESRDMEGSPDAELMWMFRSELDETEPESGTEVEPEPQMEVEPEPGTEVEPEPGTEVDPEPGTEVEPEPTAVPRAHLEAEPAGRHARRPGR